MSISAETMIEPKEPVVRETLRFLFGGKDRWGLVRDLAVAPALPAHRNQVSESLFFLPVEHFGGVGDLPLMPLMRRVVDKSLRAFSSFFPAVYDQVGRSPISPHGSMLFSIRRWGEIDWSFVRDLDWRIYLPPQIGHESGFLTHIHNTLEQELRASGLSPVFRGKDPDGRPQVQLCAPRSGMVHGFHLFLLSMEAGFIRRSLHEGGGYTIHQAYFPEDSINPYLEQDLKGVLWDDLILRQREHYEEMYRRISFNTFGGNDTASTRLKTRGWYSRKAFKWYAVLAEVRGLEDLEHEILDQYRSFHGSHEELVHLVRHHYFARLDPETSEPRRLDRELSFALSLAYARGRCAPGDRLGGRIVASAASSVLMLEPVPAGWLANAFSFLTTSRMDGPGIPAERWPELRLLASEERIRFADGISEPGFYTLSDGKPVVLIPSVWSFVLSETSVHRFARVAAGFGLSIDTSVIQVALVALLASQLVRAVAATERNGS